MRAQVVSAIAAIMTLTTNLASAQGVESPITANEVFYLTDQTTPSTATAPTGTATPPSRYAVLQAARDVTETTRDRFLHDRAPISVVIREIYLPNLRDDRGQINRCSRRITDVFHGDRRDYVVMASLSGSPTPDNQEDFIAIWYETNVPSGRPLTFRDLLIHSIDSWRSSQPLYVRFRVIDVTAERNQITRHYLGKIAQTGSNAAILAGAAPFLPAVQFATDAATMVLANERDRSVIDFTFQLYDADRRDDGGAHLGVVRTGEMLVTALPCGATQQFWGQTLRLDRTTRTFHPVLAQGASVAAANRTPSGYYQMPYVIAAIVNRDMAVPGIVRTRSSAILELLGATQQSNDAEAQERTERLLNSLGALEQRNRFRSARQAEAFAVFASQAQIDWPDLDPQTRQFYLDSFFHITGRNYQQASDYVGWYERCGAVLEFDPQTQRFVRPTSTTTAGASGAAPTTGSTAAQC